MVQNGGKDEARIKFECKTIIRPTKSRIWLRICAVGGNGTAAILFGYCNRAPCREPAPVPSRKMKPPKKRMETELEMELTTWLQGFETALIYFPFRTLSFSLSTKIFTKKENFRRNYAELIMCTAHILVLVAVVRMLTLSSIRRWSENNK